ncbi:MAG: 50S ribosomal protein L7ae [Thaumarchaeota archaeon]|nr:MAG: 50S ribosomal protein L7ae [Nitrososphaerota archaeon]
MSSIEKPQITEIKDLRRHLEVISRTGKLIFGFRQSYLSVLHRRSKLIILANNCPPNLEREIVIACKMTGTPYIKVPYPGTELGYMAGKPFSAAVISIIDPGNSTILDEIAPEKEEEAY